MSRTQIKTNNQTREEISNKVELVHDAEADAPVAEAVQPVVEIYDAVNVVQCVAVGDEAAPIAILVPPAERP